MTSPERSGGHSDTVVVVSFPILLFKESLAMFAVIFLGAENDLNWPGIGKSRISYLHSCRLCYLDQCHELSFDDFQLFSRLQ